MPMSRGATRCAPIRRSTSRCSRASLPPDHSRLPGNSLPPAKLGMLPAMPAVHVHQILNYYTPREALDPGFLLLDNSANERPDWYEYWPIRKYLREQPLDEDACYAFLSPKFRLKTNLGAAQVREFIERAGADIDVFLFSPSIHNSAYYWNVFEHGESEHPGLAGIAARFVARIDPATRLDELVSDSRNTVHSNYFIAKPRFWRAWVEGHEAVFAR